VSVGAFVNRGIAFAASREGLAFIEDLLAPALDDALREWESKRDLQG
jgi:hypothetical protein